MSLLDSSMSPWTPFCLLLTSDLRSKWLGNCLLLTQHLALSFISTSSHQASQQCFNSTVFLMDVIWKDEKHFNVLMFRNMLMDILNLSNFGWIAGLSLTYPYAPVELLVSGVQ